MAIKHSLVVPCYNEEENVVPFFRAAQAAMAGYTDSYEIVFVNDGSGDQTMDKLRDVFRERGGTAVKVICFSRNFGKEAAMYAGLRETSGDYVTVIDADLQQRPEVAVEMGRFLDTHPTFDMVAAFQAQRKENAFIARCKKRFYALINRMTEVRFIPDASDFRTMRRPVVESLLRLSEYHRFSKGLFSWVGYQTYSLPYEVMEREHGESKWNFRKLLRYALDGIMAYTDLPLKLPLYTGGVCMGLGVLLAILFLILSLCLPTPQTVGFLVSLLLFLAGMILLSQGVMGAYLGKVHTQVKSRPIYIEKEKLTYEKTDPEI